MGVFFFGGGGGVVGLNFLSLMVNVNSRLTRENANYFLENHPPPPRNLWLRQEIKLEGEIGKTCKGGGQE